jgi:hypothetical protein
MHESNKPDIKFSTKCRIVVTYDAYNETLNKQQQENEIKISQAMNKRQTTLESVETFICHSHIVWIFLTHTMTINSIFAAPSSSVNSLSQGGRKRNY